MKREFPKHQLLRNTFVEKAQSFEHAQWLHKYQVGYSGHRDYKNAYQECLHDCNIERITWLAEHCNVRNISKVLEEAAALGKVDFVKYLATKCDTDDLWDALFVAARYGNLDIIKFIATIVPKEAKCSQSWGEVLCLAAGNGHCKLVIFLLSNDPGKGDGAREERAISDSKDLKMIRLIHETCSSQHLPLIVSPLQNALTLLSAWRAYNKKTFKYLLRHRPPDLTALAASHPTYPPKILSACKEFGLHL